MLEVLDTAGQEEYTALRDQWIRDGEGFILVYSITSRNSYDRIRKFYNQVQRVKESSHPGSPTGHSYLQQQLHNGPVYSGPVPVMLVGNKSDKHREREVSSQEGQALARELGCDFVEASAKNCVNVEKAFYDVVRALKKQRQNPLPSDRRQNQNNSAKNHHDPEPGRHGGRQKRSTKCVIL